MLDGFNDVLSNSLFQSAAVFLAYFARVIEKVVNTITILLGGEVEENEEEETL